MQQLDLSTARDLIRIGDLKSALRSADAEIKSIGDQASASETWELRFVRAQVLELLGKVEPALDYLESFPPPAESEIECRAALKMHRGYLLGYLGRSGISHNLLGEAEASARDSGLMRLLGDIYLSRAFILFREKDYASSGDLYRSALNLSETVEGWHLRGYGRWGVGKNLMIQEQYREAMPWFDESLQIFEEAEARLAIALVWSELAVCHLGLGQDRDAMNLLRKAELVNYECGAAHNYQVVLANIGNVYLYRRDYLTAIAYYRRAVDLAREIEDPVSIKKWTYNINLAYARIRAGVDESGPRTA